MNQVGGVSVFNEVSGEFFAYGVEEGDCSVPSKTVKSWFEKADDIGSVMIAYWIEPPYSFCVLKENTYGNIEYVLFEPGKLFLTDKRDEEDEHDCIASYYEQKEDAAYGLLYGVKSDSFVGEVTISDEGITCTHRHPVIDQEVQIVNVGGQIATRNIIENLRVEYGETGGHVLGDEFTGSLTGDSGESVFYSLRDSNHVTVKFNERDEVSPVDLVDQGVYSVSVLAYLWEVLNDERVVVVTGVNKHSRELLVNALAQLISGDERVLSYHDYGDFVLPHREWYEYTQMDIPSGSNGESFANNIMTQDPGMVVVGDVEQGCVSEYVFRSVSSGLLTSIEGDELVSGLNSCMDVEHEEGIVMNSSVDVIVSHEYISPDELVCSGVGEVNEDGELRIIDESLVTDVGVVGEESGVVDEKMLCVREDFVEMIVDSDVACSVIFEDWLQS